MGVQRFNQTLVRKISKANYDEESDETLKDWTTDLRTVLMEYNTEVHSAHGHRPFDVFRGRSPFLLLDAPKLQGKCIREDIMLTYPLRRKRECRDNGD